MEKNDSRSPLAVLSIIANVALPLGVLIYARAYWLAAAWILVVAAFATWIKYGRAKDEICKQRAAVVGETAIRVCACGWVIGALWLNREEALPFIFLVAGAWATIWALKPLKDW